MLQRWRRVCLQEDMQLQTAATHTSWRRAAVYCPYCAANGVECDVSQPAHIAANHCRQRPWRGRLAGVGSEMHTLSRSDVTWNVWSLYNLFCMLARAHSGLPNAWWHRPTSHSAQGEAMQSITAQIQLVHMHTAWPSSPFTARCWIQIV